ncbi:hypothetical protein FRC09_006108 [Ceratobasidium sp. 395]|nr:hypothetical protein FRC09_006108 [Ceratobasidium sp. 395]
MATLDTRPAGRKPRTLVLCFDGTTNIYDDANTNVIKLFTLLEKNKLDEQMVYYQPGVGTYAPPGIFLGISIAIAKVLDQAIALYLDQHVMGGYEFLMKHYHDGDKICLFGFSRGAYTARALAGMLHKVGLLPPDNIEQIPFAYSMYNRNDKAGFKASALFKKAFSRTVRIEFLGVWDTVSSVGLLWPRHLPFTASNSIVKRFRHAVSLDEHRAKFKHNVWQVHTTSEADAQYDPNYGSPIISTNTASTIHTSPVTVGPSQMIAPKLNPVQEPNINVITATPPTREADSLDAHEHRGSLWLAEGKSTDFVTATPISSPGIHETDPSKPNGQSWHPDEPTCIQGASSDSGVEDPGAEHPKDVKSTVQATTSGAHDSASSGKAKQKQPSAGILGWLKSPTPTPAPTPTPPKPSTQMSGAARFEEAWEQRHADPNKIEPDTDVLECGIQFNQNALKEMDIPLPTLSFGRSNLDTVFHYKPDAEAVKAAKDREQQDAIAPMHDSLKNPLWWLLEFFPIVHAYQDERGKWHRSFRWNLFGPRHARTTLGILKLHRSVQYRQQNTDYIPRAILPAKVEYVD